MDDVRPCGDWKWHCSRKSWDRLEAAVRLCWNTHKGVNFRLVSHVRELAEAMGCSVRTIRRALKDGYYEHLWESGGKLFRVGLFSAERMEQVHAPRWRNKGRPKFHESVSGDDRAAYDLLVDVLMRKPLAWEFRPSAYAAREMVLRFLPKSRLPCERTVRNYANAAGNRRDASGLSARILRRRLKHRGTSEGRRKKGESPSRLGHTFSDRPPEVVSPSVVGHLEGDTVYGPKGMKGVYYSFIDRVSSRQFIIPRSNRKERSTFKAVRVLKDEFGGVIHSVTFDRGSEFNNWKRIEKILGASVFYADAFNSCQRAKNENNHILIRWQSPKGERLKCRTVREGFLLAQYINDYPRRKFNGMSANEMHGVYIRC